MQRGITKHDFYLFKGVNAFGEDNRIPKDAVYYAENCRFEGFRLSNRMGYQNFDDSLSGSDNIKSLFNYEIASLTDKKEYLVSYYNEKFYRLDTETNVTVEIVPTGWATSNEKINAQTYRNNLYVFDGVNEIGKIDDTTFSVVSGSPKGMFGEAWIEKLWTVSSDARSTVQYTRTATASNPEYIDDWTTVGAAGAELIGAGGSIVGLKTLNTKLYAFKTDAIEEFTGFDLSQSTPVCLHSPLRVTSGAISQKAITLVENDIWFLTPELEIRRLGQEMNYSNESPRTRDVTNTLQRYKKLLDPDQSGAVSVYNKGIYKISFKSLNSTSNDIKFVWDFNAKMWSFDKNTSQTDYAVNYGNVYFVVDGQSEIIYRDDVGYSDAGFSMSWKATLGLQDDGAPDVVKNSRYLYVRGSRSKGVITYVYLLGEDRERLETHIVEAPTEAEMALDDRAITDAFGQIGDDLVGGFGYKGAKSSGPAVYRFNARFSSASKSRMFGIEFESALNNQIINIDEAKLYYIPRTANYYQVTS